MNVQHLEVSAGEDRTLTLRARNASNVPVNLTAKAVAVYVGRSPYHPSWTDVLITMTGTVTDAPNGVFTIPVLATDTRFRGGDYQYIARATDSLSAIESICTGRFRVIPELVTG